jgi:Arc/MetJ-type ribon-helix-helix transcriptional regulator
MTSDAKKSQPKVKLVRDSFTLPEVDHDLIKQCKKAAIVSGRETKKSEVVRAAIRAFSELSTAQQLAAYAKLQSIAVGRPKSK